jgi:trk system potassium uptake protein TrkH
MHVCGIALLFLSLGIAVSATVSFFDNRVDLTPLFLTSIIVAVLGLTLFTSTTVGETDQASIFSAVGGTWLVVSLLGALPYLFAGTFNRNGIGAPEIFIDSLFESVSGFSCTGSTVFGAHNLIELQGTGILFYRQLTQWLGGMGIVVLVVSVLPSLRASGLGLIDAEAPGAGVERIAPRVVETAKKFWYIYASLTFFVSISLFAAGMGVFDSIAHAMTTASTGGFSTRDLSIGHWNSISIEIVIMVGLMLGATNFTLHARSIEKRRIDYGNDSEFKSFITLVVSGVILVTLILTADGASFSTALRSASFNVITLGSSGGFGNTLGAGTPGDFVSWSASAQLVLLFFLIFGGCTGSTSGGVKIMRLRIGLAHTYRTLRSVRRPRALLQARMGSRTIPDTLVERVAGFVVVYGILVVIGTFILTALGSDLITSLSGVFSALGNMGPGLGEIGPSSSFVDGFSAPGRLVLLIFMMIGRLEIFPMLLMFVLPYRNSMKAIKTKK